MSLQKDVRVFCTNSDKEPFFGTGIGRKNYLFCGDDDAAQRAAVVYSLLATCKARGVDERTWLEDVFCRIP